MILLSISFTLCSSETPAENILTQDEVIQLSTFQSLSEVYIGRIVAFQLAPADDNSWMRAKIIRVVNGPKIYCKLRLNATVFFTVNVDHLRQLPDESK